MAVAIAKPGTSNKQTNNNDWLEKDGGTKNMSTYKDEWSGIQTLVSAHWLLLDPSL